MPEVREEAGQGLSDYDGYRIDVSRRWLESVRRHRMRCDLLHDDVTALMLDRSGMTGIDYSMTRTRGGGDDAMVNAVARLDELVERYNREYHSYLGEFEEASRLVGKLGRPEWSQALHLHYLRGLKWPEVEERMSYSHSRMMEIRRLALVAVYDLVPRGWRDEIPDARG